MPSGILLLCTVESYEVLLFSSCKCRMYFIDVVVCFLSSVSWALHLSLCLFYSIFLFIFYCWLLELLHVASLCTQTAWTCTNDKKKKISWFLIYDLHYSHNTPVGEPLDQDQLSNSFLVTPTLPRRLVSLTAALRCLLSDYGNVILTLGNVIVQQTVKIDNLRFACMHASTRRRAPCRHADGTFCCVQPC